MGHPTAARDRQGTLRPVATVLHRALAPGPVAGMGTEPTCGVLARRGLPGAPRSRQVRSSLGGSCGVSLGGRCECCWLCWAPPLLGVPLLTQRSDRRTLSEGV